MTPTPQTTQLSDDQRIALSSGGFLTRGTTCDRETALNAAMLFYRQRNAARAQLESTGRRLVDTLAELAALKHKFPPTSGNHPSLQKGPVAMDIVAIMALIQMILEMIAKCQEAEAIKRLRRFGLVEAWLLRGAMLRAGWTREQIAAGLAYAKQAAADATDDELTAFVKEAQAKAA
jgi:hypothetical protein